MSGAAKSRMRNDTGLALLMAIGYLAALALLGSAFLAGVHRVSANSQRNVERHETALNLAEGGIHSALALLRVDSNYSGEKNVPLGPGRYSVTVERRENNKYSVRCRGEIVDDGLVLHAVTMEVTAVLTNGQWSIFSWRESKPELRTRQAVEQSL